MRFFLLCLYIDITIFIYDNILSVALIIIRTWLNGFTKMWQNSSNKVLKDESCDQESGQELYPKSTHVCIYHRRLRCWLLCVTVVARPTRECLLRESRGMANNLTSGSIRDRWGTMPFNSTFDKVYCEVCYNSNNNMISDGNDLHVSTWLWHIVLLTTHAMKRLSILRVSKKYSQKFPDVCPFCPLCPLDVEMRKIEAIRRLEQGFHAIIADPCLHSTKSPYAAAAVLRPVL